MSQCCHREYNEFSSEYTNTKSESYKTGTRTVHHRLAVQTKPQGKQRCRNTWFAIEYGGHTDNDNIPDCMTIQQLQQAASQNDHLQQLEDYIIRGWSENKDKIPQDM